MTVCTEAKFFGNRRHSDEPCQQLTPAVRSDGSDCRQPCRRTALVDLTFLSSLERHLDPSSVSSDCDHDGSSLSGHNVYLFNISLLNSVVLTWWREYVKG